MAKAERKPSDGGLLVLKLTLKEREKWEGLDTHGGEVSKQRWKQRVINGAIWSDWHRTGPGGGVLLVAYVPLRYHRHKQVSNLPFVEGCSL